jgi:hypothetical protein
MGRRYRHTNRANHGGYSAEVQVIAIAVLGGVGLALFTNFVSLLLIPLALVALSLFPMSY